MSGATKAQAEQEQLRILADYDVDAVVLARYMQVLSARFLQQYPARIINIHHSFLPASVGANPYQAAYDRGATAHYVTEELDAGPIIEQDVLRIDHRHDADDLRRLGRYIGTSVHAWCSRAVGWHVEDRVLLHGNKTIVFNECGLCWQRRGTRCVRRGRGAAHPGASRCYARKLAAHSFPPRPPAKGLFGNAYQVVNPVSSRWVSTASRVVVSLDAELHVTCGAANATSGSQPQTSEREPSRQDGIVTSGGRDGSREGSEGGSERSEAMRWARARAARTEWDSRLVRVAE